MAETLLTLLVVGLAAVVVVALFLVLWRERTSARDARVAILTGVVLTLWAVAATVLAYRGGFEPPELERVPRIGLNLIVVLSVLFVSLASSASLRRLLTRQASLTRLHLWRLVGFVFLLLMMRGRVPALWALPAGIGDILVGVTAPWVARNIDTPRGHRRAVIFNLFGMADLIVAVGLGTMLSPGATQVVETVPTTEFMTQFPMALVPTFLVPLAFTLHVVSLWQLLGRAWVPRPAASFAPSR